MKTLAEMIEVMRSAERGEEIECIKLNEPWDKYELIQHPVWNWRDFDYRVQPKSRIRPFTRADMTDEVRWIKGKSWKAESNAILVTGVGMSVIECGNRSFYWPELQKSYQWSSSINGPWHPFTKEEV